LKKQILLLTLVAVASIACGSNLNAQGEQPAFVDQPIKILKPPIPEKLNSGESKPSEVPSRNAEVWTKGWELTVHIKGTHAEGDLRIITKEDFAKKDIERAILILVLAQIETTASSKIEPTIETGDRIICRKYKENSDKPTKAELYHWFQKLRRIKRLLKDGMEKEKLLPYDFTYYEFMNAVEKLLYKDELTLGGDIISVKNRAVKELPDSAFTIATKPPRCCD